ncbi:MAG TPA: 1-deoxy-D-xylulose-5-phosphate synthase [Verrucomicrobiota bacterium]|nr:1-deoxy-D-xylulose-5-phosphate synthase [Verrucomicrobiota bacterium]HNU52088.1 1-deoxy-D-xylulose-5-phosphate synthase [Verrucomicrobiota bacterium]
MSRYLDMVDSPEHVKKLTLEQLTPLAEDIRHELITVLSKNGGHLGPNLGVVELTLALHRVFRTPEDKILWDVSHQCYVHKLLTGRKKLFHTIRTTGGLNGFACRAESEHDCYGAGHAGTALSAALGICAARDLRGTREHVVCVFGDAALTNGISFEALNNIAHTTRRFIGVLNDNEFSIAKNVGAISRYLNQLITHPRYSRLQKDFQRLLRRMPKGEIAIRLGHKAEEALKGAVSQAALEPGAPLGTDGRGGYGSSLIFEEMGLSYLGPIDGHDLPLLIESLTFARECEKPVVLHVITQKGKGFEAARRQPEKYHGVGPYDISTGDILPAKPGTPPNYQDVFGRALVTMCQRDSTLVGITAAMPSGTGMKFLEQALPQRYYDVGIAEEHAVLFAAGMATLGFRPFVAIYSTFLQRGYDCILHDVALQDLPVVFCMDRAGLSATDGPTHHGLFDIAFLRCVPNVVIMAPKDEDELVDMMFTATRQNHPVCIRYPRGAGEGVPIKNQPRLLEIGKAEVLRHFAANGRPKVAIFPLGNLQRLGAEAADRLAAAGCDVAIVNPRFAKPLDEGAHLFFGRAADVVVTLEDHALMGGYGSAVLECYSQHRVAVPVVRIGWPDQFIEHATTAEVLRDRHGLTADAIVHQVRQILAPPAALAAPTPSAAAAPPG